MIIELLVGGKLIVTREAAQEIAYMARSTAHSLEYSDPSASDEYYELAAEISELIRTNRGKSH